MKLVDSDSMRALDRKAIREFGIKGLVLMENAGRGVADAVEKVLDKDRPGRIAVVAGKGNNGGDGFVSARHLHNRGHDVTVFALAETKEIKGDAGTNARIWERMGGRTICITSGRDLRKNTTLLRHASVIVDAIFGTGLGSEVRGIYGDVIDTINSLEKPVVAVDIPSGMDATTGRVLGRAVRAHLTATMAFAKIGCYLYPGRDYTGRVEVVDIGMPPEVCEGEKIRWNLIDSSMVGRLLGPRRRDTHKGTYGHVLIIGGSTGKSGAVYMAGMGAMRVGTGLATVAVPEGLNPVMEAKTTEVMSHPLPETITGTLGEHALDETRRILAGKNAVVLGPGLGTLDMLGFVEKVVSMCAESGLPVVLDADALNSLGTGVSVLKKAAGRGAGIVLTPHPGEMSRLLGTDTGEVQADRIGCAERLAEETGAVVVLKGASTVVAASGSIYINPTGNPGMATAGTGDVLSGMIGGLLAQGLAPVDAAVASVYLHGLAGDEAAARIGEAGLMATDLLDEIPPLLKRHSLLS